jgi:hypothetical protein
VIYREPVCSRQISARLPCPAVVYERRTMNSTLRVTPPAKDEPWWTCEFQIPVEQATREPKAAEKEDSPLTFKLLFTELTDPQEFVLWRVTAEQPNPREQMPRNIEVRGLVALEQAARRNLELLARDEFQVKVRRSRRELTPEFLANVARRHRLLAEQGAAPTKALAEEEGVAGSTVKNWLRQAREAGIGEES